MAVHGAAIHLNLGTVDSSSGRAFVRVMFVVDDSGKGRIQLWSADRDERNSGQLVSFGQAGLNDLRKILDDVDATVAGLQARGQCNALAVR